MAALESRCTAHRVSGGNPLLLGFQGSVVGRTGRTDDARQLVATLEQIARSHHVPPCAFARVFVGLGDHDAAFHHLDRAYASLACFSFCHGAAGQHTSMPTLRSSATPAKRGFQSVTCPSRVHFNATVFGRSNTAKSGTPPMAAK